MSSGLRESHWPMAAANENAHQASELETKPWRITISWNYCHNKLWWNPSWIVSFSFNSLPSVCHFQTNIDVRYREHFLSNCRQMNATGPQWWLFNIGSCNMAWCREAPSHITWANVDPELCHHIHIASIGRNELTGHSLLCDQPQQYPVVIKILDCPSK